jgi:hypothetical protein
VQGVSSEYNVISGFNGAGVAFPAKSIWSATSDRPHEIIREPFSLVLLKILKGYFFFWNQPLMNTLDAQNRFHFLTHFSLPLFFLTPSLFVAVRANQTHTMPSFNWHPVNFLNNSWSWNERTELKATQLVWTRLCALVLVEMLHILHMFLLMGLLPAIILLP